MDCSIRHVDPNRGQAPAEVLFRREQRQTGPGPKVTVVIPLHNYERYIAECLESVRFQTVPELDLVVADDCSRDASAETVIAWMTAHADRFHRCELLRNPVNLGLARTRNRLYDAARTDYVFPLDADNTIYPRCLEALSSALDHCDASFAYCMLELFGVQRGLMSWRPWNPQQLMEGNYIDAMALVRKAAWKSVGGYSTDMPVMGWEDYEFWLKLAQSEGWGILVPEALARYRVHLNSMLHTETNRREAQIWSYLKAKYDGIGQPDAAREAWMRQNDEIVMHCDRVRVVSTPEQGAILQVRGWALARLGVAKVEVANEDQTLGIARYGDLRPELSGRSVGKLNGTHCGFSFQARIPDPGAEGMFVVVRATSMVGKTAEVRLKRFAFTSLTAAQEHELPAIRR